MNPSDDWVDIDGRTSNGVLAGGYGSCYGSSARSDSSFDTPYVHVVPTKAQLHAEEVHDRRRDIEIKRGELVRFRQYADQHLKEHQKWLKRISDHEHEIANLEIWIQVTEAAHQIKENT